MKSDSEIIGEIAKREGSNSWAELMHESSYYDVVRCTKEAMSEYAAQQKSECNYDCIIETLKVLYAEEKGKDILGFDDFNDLMKNHEIQNSLLRVIALLKSKLPSPPKK